MKKAPKDIVKRLLDILESDFEFEAVERQPDETARQVNAKYYALRQYLEDRFGGNPLAEVPKPVVLEVVRIYRHLLRYDEVLHPVPRCERRKISAIPAMTAEVIIQFTR